MRLVAMMPCRNEAWVLRASIPAVLQWVDKLIVLAHNCTDDSLSIVFDHLRKDPTKITLATTHQHEREWDEATFRGRLLDMARKEGATHLACVDSDEILAAPAFPQIRAAASLLPPGQLLRLPWIHCWRSLDHYRCDDSPFGNARVPFLFRDAPHLTYAPDADGYQLHKRHPAQCQPVNLWERDSGMGVLHLQHANWARVVAKQKRYAEDELRRWGKVRANYAAATDETGLELKHIPKEWWPVEPGLVDLGAKAWQEEV